MAMKSCWGGFHGTFRIKANGLVVVLNRLIVFALSFPSDTTVVKGVGRARFKKNRFIEILDCLIELTLLIEGIASVVVGDSILGVETNCFVEVTDPAVVSTIETFLESPSYTKVE